MAVKSYALTTAQRAADFAGLGTLSGTKLTQMERLVDSVTEFVENYLGYRVKKASYTNEEYDTEDAQMLLLKNFPVDSAESFVLQRRTSALNEAEWETVDSQYYHVDTNAGIVYGASGWKFSRTRRGYRVSYTAGYNFDNLTTYLSDTEGGDIELAAWMLLSLLWDIRKGGVGVESERIGDYAVTYRRLLMENEDIQTLLDKHARMDTFGVLTPLQE
jgi:hypothetical protein